MCFFLIFSLMKDQGHSGEGFISSTNLQGATCTRDSL